MYGSSPLVRPGPSYHRGVPDPPLHTNQTIHGHMITHVEKSQGGEVSPPHSQKQKGVARGGVANFSTLGLFHLCYCFTTGLCSSSHSSMDPCEPWRQPVAYKASRLTKATHVAFQRIAVGGGGAATFKKNQCLNELGLQAPQTCI